MTSEEILFLRRTDVIAALAGVDTLDCVKRVLIEHAAGRSSLPEEGYLRNPFGMSILDVGLIDAVYQSARQQGLGRQLSVY